MVIRPAEDRDHDAIWQIFHHVVAARDSYAFAPDTPREVGVGYWLGADVTSFVTEIDGRVVGVYKLIANGPALAAHVANASFMVAPSATRQGAGRAMGQHALREARAQGYDAMQFNFVVSTNHAAVALWQQLGFRIVGTLPRVFRHGTLGPVDAYVMHRSLDDIVLTFGRVRDGAATEVRQSAYAVLSRGQQLALVRSRDDVMLPGGGIDAGEEPADAVAREVAEECAVRVRLVQSLGDARQRVGGRDGRPLIEKQSRFFSGVIAGVLDGRQAEHEVLWLTVEDALHTTTSESHAWAIRRWARLNT